MKLGMDIYGDLRRLLIGLFYCRATTINPSTAEHVTTHRDTPWEANFARVSGGRRPGSFRLLAGYEYIVVFYGFISPIITVLCTFIA